jgi:hypothetical protein
VKRLLKKETIAGKGYAASETGAACIKKKEYRRKDHQKGT